MSTDILPKPIRKEPPKEVIEFTRPVSSGKRENKPKKQKNNEQTDKDDDENVMSLKQAKFDVFKFGIKGFDKEKQEDAKIQLAIKLGAAPPKNQCINYKELMNKKREEKELKEKLIKENRQFEAKVLDSQKGGKKRKSLNSIKKAKISKGHVGDLKGHIGSFSNGVLKLKKRDIFGKSKSK